jgi:hypothetical protein
VLELDICLSSIGVVKDEGTCTYMEFRLIFQATWDGCYGSIQGHVGLGARR